MDRTEAVERILALQDLTAATGTKTTRVQGKILRSLSDDDLPAVALELKLRGAIRDILAGRGGAR